MASKLKFKCNGKEFEIKPVKADKNVNLANKTPATLAPGAGDIEISTPILSAETVTSGGEISCKTTISGRNIAQISLEVMLQLGRKMVGPICRDFLRSPEDRETKGILRPRWTAENGVEFNVPSGLKLLYCGEGFTLACMWPERYGTAADDQTWNLEGVYQRGGGEPFRARFEFDHQGALIRKTGFYPTSMRGLISPFELFIEDGDTFEPYVTILTDGKEEGLATVNPIMLGGGCLLHWVPAETPDGIYHVGVLVEDFDGQEHRKYSSFTIKK